MLKNNNHKVGFISGKLNLSWQKHTNLFLIRLNTIIFRKRKMTEIAFKILSRLKLNILSFYLRLFQRLNAI